MAVVSLTSYSCGTTTYSILAPFPCSLRNVSRISLSRSTRGVWLWPQKVTSAPAAAGPVFGLAGAGVAAGCELVLGAAVAAAAGADVDAGAELVLGTVVGAAGAAVPPQAARNRA